MTPIISIGGGTLAEHTAAAEVRSAGPMRAPDRSALARGLIPAVALHAGTLGLLAWRIVSTQPVIAPVEPTISFVALPAAAASPAAAPTISHVETTVPPTETSSPPETVPSIPIAEPPSALETPALPPVPMAATAPAGVDPAAIPAPTLANPPPTQATHERVPHDPVRRVMVAKPGPPRTQPALAPPTPVATSMPVAALNPTVSPGSRPATVTGVAEVSFEQRIRESVQDAVRYPAAARMMGITGRARLELVYRAGAVSTVVLARSAGEAMLDDAAVRAAHAAHYPAAPTEVGDRTLRFLIWVEFGAS